MRLMFKGILLEGLHGVYVEGSAQVACNDARTAKIIRTFSPADRAALADLVRRGPQMDDSGS